MIRVGAFKHSVIFFHFRDMTEQKLHNFRLHFHFVVKQVSAIRSTGGHGKFVCQILNIFSRRYRIIQGVDDYTGVWISPSGYGLAGVTEAKYSAAVV